MSRRELGTLRIIGGRWRSRLIDFEPEEGIRPTPDRVRQTLFDWLAPSIQGATCLDLFAGSGAIGLEALSRGAGAVTFVERNHSVARHIEHALQVLQEDEEAEVIECDALDFLARTNGQYDAVFVDPPYHLHLLPRVLDLLPRVLKHDARVYLEWGDDDQPQLPAGWFWQREKRAGQVGYGLAAWEGAAT